MAAVVVPLVLFGSLVGQLRRPGVLGAALRAHRVLPGVLVRPVVVGVLLAEAVVGGTVAAGLASGGTGLFRGGLGGGAALLAAYALYGAYVARTRRGVPCGCAGSVRTPMTGWVAARAAVLAGFAVAGALGGVPDPAAVADWIVIVVAGLAIAVILWTLPPSMLERNATG